MQGNAGEYKGNIWEWAQCEGNSVECRQMQGNARETNGYVCKVPGECR